MLDLLVLLFAAVIGGITAIYLMKNKPDLLEKWKTKLKEKVDKL